MQRHWRGVTHSSDSTCIIGVDGWYSRSSAGQILPIQHVCHLPPQTVLPNIPPAFRSTDLDEGAPVTTPASSPSVATMPPGLSLC